jgi:hypothetical protein
MDQQNFNNTVVMTVLAISLIPVIFYKRIPWIKKFTSKPARVLWSVGFVFLPSNILGMYQQGKNQ